MKIIGTTEVGEGYSKLPAYVCIITHAELQRVADKARHDSERIVVKVGDDYPIAEGYNFRGELLQAIKAMQDAYSKFAKVAPVAAQFAGIAIKAEAEQTGGSNG